MPVQTENGGGAYNPFYLKPTTYPMSTPNQSTVYGSSGVTSSWLNSQSQKKSTPSKKKPKLTSTASKMPTTGYYPSSVYSGSSGGGGGGGGGGGTAAAKPKEYMQYGITPDWMKAYKQFWGQQLPERLWGMYNPITELYSRYMGRLPQMADWTNLWEQAQSWNAVNKPNRKNWPVDLAVYEPFISGQVRPPLFTPPSMTYAPYLSF